MFEIRDSILLQYTPAPGETEVILPEGIREIGARAFCRCTELTGVTIPYGVERIGAGAFFYCGQLREIAIPWTVEEIGPMAFSFCTSLTRLQWAGRVDVRELQVGGSWKCFDEMLAAARDHRPVMGGEPVRLQFMMGMFRVTGYEKILDCLRAYTRDLFAYGDEEILLCLIQEPRIVNTANADDLLRIAEERGHREVCAALREWKAANIDN